MAALGAIGDVGRALDAALPDVGEAAHAFKSAIGHERSVTAIERSPPPLHHRPDPAGDAASLHGAPDPMSRAQSPACEESPSGKCAPTSSVPLRPSGRFGGGNSRIRAAVGVINSVSAARQQNARLNAFLTTTTDNQVAALDAAEAATKAATEAAKIGAGKQKQAKLTAEMIEQRMRTVTASIKGAD